MWHSHKHFIRTRILNIHTTRELFRLVAESISWSQKQEELKLPKSLRSTAGATQFRNSLTAKCFSLFDDTLDPQISASASVWSGLQCKPHWLNFTGYKDICLHLKSYALVSWKLEKPLSLLLYDFILGQDKSQCMPWKQLCSAVYSLYPYLFYPISLCFLLIRHIHSFTKTHSCTCLCI